MFERWGRFVHRRRLLVLGVSALVLVASVAGLIFGGKFKQGEPPSSVPSFAANRLTADELPKIGGSSFVVVFGSAGLDVSDPAYRSAVEAALDPLRADSRVTSIRTPYDATPERRAAMTSRDGHRALAFVGLRDDRSASRIYFNELTGRLHSPTLRIWRTGNVAIQQAFDSTLEADLNRAETVSLPLSLLLLLLIFGTVVAALLPLGVGVLAIVGGVAGTLVLARFTDVSSYALNIVTLIGLGVAIDYSLFVVNRFREELASGRDVPDSLGATMASAGRAVIFSGMTVAVGLGGMLFYRGTFLASMGAAGGIVVAMAVFYAVTFLPALLAVLGPRVNRLRVDRLWRQRGRRPPHRSGFWEGLAAAVMRRPLLVLVPTVLVLLVAGSPFLHLRLANGDVDQLPPANEARQGYDLLFRDFPNQDQTRITVVLHYPSGSPLTAERVGYMYDLSRDLARQAHVLRVESVVDLDPKLGRAGYQSLLAGGAALLPPDAQAVYRASIGRDIATLSVLTAGAPEGDEARAIVRAARAQTQPPGGELLVTGQTAIDMDIIGYIVDHTPLALAFVMLATYLIIWLLVGSIVLPLKAVLMNLVSISASFGALVFFFQDGHLSHQLNFTPDSIDPSVPVILFSIVFGLSMDYEVILLSRIQEEYRRTGDNVRAVAHGLERSGRLITGAGAIMVGVFAAFGLADVVLVKAIGLGMALAVAIDATLVRALLVPAIMRLLGDLNWWSPSPVRALHERLGQGEAGRTTAPVEV